MCSSGRRWRCRWPCSALGSQLDQSAALPHSSLRCVARTYCMDSGPTCHQWAAWHCNCAHGHARHLISNARHSTVSSRRRGRHRRSARQTCCGCTTRSPSRRPGPQKRCRWGAACGSCFCTIRGNPRAMQPLGSDIITQAASLCRMQRRRCDRGAKSIRQNTDTECRRSSRGCTSGCTQQKGGCCRRTPTPRQRATSWMRMSKQRWLLCGILQVYRQLGFVRWRREAAVVL